MADNVTANPGTGGATFATDDIGGVQFPRHKLIIGADGVNDGDVSAANPLPITATSLTTIASAIKAEDSVFVTGDAGIQMLAVRQDAMAALGADGDYAPLQVNATGRLKVSAEPAAQVAITGNITGNGQTVSMDTSRTSNITIYCTGTFSTVNCAFEGSLDGTNWFGVQAIRTNANTIETTTGNLSAAPAYAWELSVNGLNNFRVRSTAWTSGTQAWRFQPAPYATEPIPAAQISGTQPVSGTVTATVTSTRITPNAADGHSTTSHLISAATTNGTVVKGSAGAIGQIVVSNNAASASYFKLYNSTTVTVGTTTPVLTALVPAGGTIVLGGNSPIRCSTGICIGLTKGIAVADTTAVGASEMAVSIFYT